MILLIGAYLFFKGLFWCFAAMIWLCFAVSGFMLVGMVALILLPLGAGGEVWRSGIRSLRPPAYLRNRKSRT
jgi:hypothetical protein